MDRLITLDAGQLQGYCCYGELLAEPVLAIGAAPCSDSTNPRASTENVLFGTDKWVIAFGS